MMTRHAETRHACLKEYRIHSCAGPCPDTQELAQQLHGQQQLSAALQEARDVIARPGAEADARPVQGAEPGGGGAAGATVGHPDAQSQPQQQLSTRSNLAQVPVCQLFAC